MTKYAIKWQYEHFVQQRTTSKLFAQRYNSYKTAKTIADNTFWEHSLNGRLICRVSASVVTISRKGAVTPQTDLLDLIA